MPVEIHDLPRRAPEDAPLGDAGVKALREERQARKTAERQLRKLTERIEALENRPAVDLPKILSGVASIRADLQAEQAAIRGELQELAAAVDQLREMVQA